MSASAVRADLAALANPAKAKILSRFFKTGPGQYGEGDRFLGISVPLLRIVARKYATLPLPALDTLLKSPLHEERAAALMVLVRQYEKGSATEKKACFDFYVERLERVNNWDLVDASAAQIVGAQLLSGNRAVLRRMATSANLWERRVAIVSTFAFIRAGEFADTFAISESLLSDKHDLIHKAVGWMLREVGKRVSEEELRRFLKKNAPHMPRTALRYAIERFPEPERKRWLA